MKNAIVWVLLSISSCFSISGNHAVESDTITAQDVLEMVAKGKMVILKGKTIQGDLDFTQIPNQHPLSKTVFQTEIKSPVYFENCVFLGNITAFQQSDNQTTISQFFSTFTIIDSKMAGDIDFSHSRLRGAFSIVNSKLEGNFNASNANFYDLTAFTASQFQKDINCSYSTYYHRSTSICITVHGKVYLQGAYFYKDAIWSNSEFRDYVDISKIVSQTAFMMDYCRFNGPLVISGSDFRGPLNLVQSKYTAQFTIRTSMFVTPPVLDTNGREAVEYEKNRLLIDENLSRASIKE